MLEHWPQRFAAVVAWGDGLGRGAAGSPVALVSDRERAVDRRARHSLAVDVTCNSPSGSRVNRERPMQEDSDDAVTRRSGDFISMRRYEWNRHLLSRIGLEGFH